MDLGFGQGQGQDERGLNILFGVKKGYTMLIWLIYSKVIKLFKKYENLYPKSELFESYL